MAYKMASKEYLIFMFLATIFVGRHLGHVITTSALEPAIIFYYCDINDDKFPTGFIWVKPPPILLESR